MDLDYCDSCRVCQLIQRLDESCAKEYFDCVADDSTSIERKMANDRYVRRQSRHKVMALAYAHHHLRKSVSEFFQREM
jgi:hypothetical protein